MLFSDAFWLTVITIILATIGIVFGAYFGRWSVKGPKSKKRNPSVLFGERNIQDWERQFALTPVRTLDEDWIWLKYYWVRKVYLPVVTEDWEESFTYQKVVKVDWYIW